MSRASLYGMSLLFANSCILFPGLGIFSLSFTKRIRSPLPVYMIYLGFSHLGPPVHRILTLASGPTLESDLSDRERGISTLARLMGMRGGTSCVTALIYAEIESGTKSEAQRRKRRHLQWKMDWRANVYAPELNDLESLRTKVFKPWLYS
jgi:hypothetical protein